jgi:hypothetical protein
MLRKVIAAILLTVFTSACAHQAAFLSEPPGARVMVDGKVVGVTPCTFDYSTSAGDSYEVSVSMDGYDTIRHEITADEVDRVARKKLLAAGLLIPGGSALMLGALFTRKLKANYEFALKKSAPTLTAQADPASETRF